MRKKVFSILLLFIIVTSVKVKSQTIRISTSETDLVLQTAANGRLYQLYLGPRLADQSEYGKLSATLRSKSDGQAWEAYPVSGTETFFEPAFAIQHNDGNMTTVLKYVSHTVKQIDDNVTETVILLKDEVYPVQVKLFYTTFAKENIIKAWTEISHDERKPVTISRYASSMLYLNGPQYFLTTFSGDWAREVNMSTAPLNFGKKIIDSKLGTRADLHVSPFFTVGMGDTPQENEGQVLMGTLAWTGNFRFTFEVDNENHLRVISGINPYASDYKLDAGKVFTTPAFIFTLSDQGTGKGSRNLQRWARNYQLKDGTKDRLTLLNNWETTGFDFDEPKLDSLMVEAKYLGVDMFLLDDGWFGNKYPRHSDTQGLGDWEVTKSKLPNGVPAMVKAAKNAGVKFGIWIEPEMVSEKSELFEKHPGWVIMQPNRERYYYRNQLVLDLSNPAVQDHVFNVVDKLMTENPDLAYLKWDCNSPVTNIYSPYLKDRQNNLYIDYVRGLYKVLDRIKAKYPGLPMMLCSGGGGRTDYGGLQYFTEFWCSDNTDPVERLFIQWGYSQFFPSKAMVAHVTSWNSQASIKFRTDVAMMCKLGFDINVKELRPEEQAFCKSAVATYNRVKNINFEGNQYRLVSPYESNHTAVMYVNEAQQQALLYTYDIYPRYAENLLPVKLKGLHPARHYRVKEINLMPGTTSTIACNDKVYSGDFLMKIGLDVFTAGKLNSRILELVAVD
ncbi:alpha-galactosidase [Chitinophaga costaii]|uniref:Alpha-galactosidase n=1 Tax=Chitinophaga costaii TaxID=1335309 RepID=A0A1C4D088_9BACT|nr:alpha-galactosidase [Chitinophaga costaii]PUZ24409.1 alpha-galactosidase [Chitinophaga costaii]SCC24854.1 alpha-galactosidase [Chitinophaga costaii]